MTITSKSLLDDLIETLDQYKNVSIVIKQPTKVNQDWDIAIASQLNTILLNVIRNKWNIINIDIPYNIVELFGLFWGYHKFNPNNDIMSVIMKQKMNDIRFQYELNNNNDEKDKYTNLCNTMNTTKPIFTFGVNWPNNIEPKYKHLKEEMLNNRYAPITEKTWNGILKKCHKFYKGQFSSKKQIKLCQIMRTNNIEMKHLVALKLWCDFDLLQREFRKSFRLPYNKSIERIASFYHWKQTLQETVQKLSNISSISCSNQTLFHGINFKMCVNKFEGIYYGPLSVTTDLHVARSFAGKNGMILIIKSDKNAINISWFSDYSDEREHLLFDQQIEIDGSILSTYYDEYYNYCHYVLTKNRMRKPPCVLTEFQLKERFDVVKTFVINIEYDKNIIKQIINFDRMEFKYEYKINGLICLMQFVLIYGKRYVDKRWEICDSKIIDVLKQIYSIHIPSNIIIPAINKINKMHHMKITICFMKSLLCNFCCNLFV